MGCIRDLILVCWATCHPMTFGTETALMIQMNHISALFVEKCSRKRLQETDMRKGSTFLRKIMHVRSVPRLLFLQRDSRFMSELTLERNLSSAKFVQEDLPNVIS